MADYVQILNYIKIDGYYVLFLYVLNHFSIEMKYYRNTVIKGTGGKIKRNLTVVSSMFITLYFNTLAEYFTHPNGTSSV